MPEQTYDYLIAPKASFDATADAIRAMKGSQDSITWGQDGFADAIGDERRFTVDEFGTTNYVSGEIVYAGTKLRSCQFMQTGITSFIGDDVNGFANDAVGSERAVFRQCTSLQSISLQKYNVTQNAQSMFSGCTSLTSINLPNLTALLGNCFQDTTALRVAKFEKVARIDAYAFRRSGIQALDLLVYCNIAGGQAFNSASNFNTLILRGSTVSPCGAVNNFEGTPFASGGTGGTLYVPNDLIASYQAATNWSTILGYTNNQIKSIESTHTDPNAPIDLTLYYADGTPIPTT